MPKYEFSENNSGGSWWLNKSDYEALFAAEWKYDRPEEDSGGLLGNPDEPWLNHPGDDTPYGWRHNLYLEAESMEVAVKNWEAATGKNFFELGCNCCGAPFSISCSDTHEYMSGDSVPHEPVRPF